MNMNQDRSMTDTGRHKWCSTGCLSWTAIIAGALVGIGLSFLLNLFGFAIGLTAFTTSPEGITTLAIGGYIGIAIGVLAIMFTAGWVAGFLGRCACDCDCNLGILYGFITWSLIILISVALTTNLGQFMTMQYESFTSPSSVVQKISSQGTTSSNTTMTNQSTSAKASTTTTNQPVTKSEERAANILGRALLLIFLLFLVGAIICSYGGYVGNCKRKNM